MYLVPNSNNMFLVALKSHFNFLLINYIECPLSYKFLTLVRCILGIVSGYTTLQENPKDDYKHYESKCTGFH